MINESGFHNKYRPRSLDDVIGQSRTVQALKNMVKEDKFPPCLAFFGLPSAGKTTMANCLVYDTIGESKSDLTSANMSDTRGIDDVRQLIQIAKLSPTNGKRRFIHLDEFQGVLSSPAAAAALLAPVELPHKKMTWIITSMSPEKFQSSTNGKAFLSRSTQFHLTPFTEEELTQQLRRICKGESMSYMTREVAQEIVRNCNGEMRTLANLLENLYNFYKGLPKSERKDKLELSDVSKVLTLSQSSDDVQAVRLLTAIYARKFSAAQKEVLNITDGFAVIQKMLYANYSVMNNAVLGGARHPKVWMTAGAKSLLQNLEKVLDTTERTKILKTTSFVQQQLVALKTRAMTFQVPEDMALSAFAYETVQALKSLGE